MKKSIIILTLVIVLVGVIFYVTKIYNKNALVPNDQLINQVEDKSTTSVSKAVNFTLTTLDGKTVTLSDYKGKKVFLNFWATWCPPCRGEMPDIEKIYQEYKDKDLVVLTVNLGEDKNTVEKFIKENKYNFSILLDTKNEASNKYGIAAIPASYFIDKEGNIATKKVGSMSYEQMKNYIEQLN